MRQIQAHVVHEAKSSKLRDDRVMLELRVFPFVVISAIVRDVRTRLRLGMGLGLGLDPHAFVLYVGTG